MRIYVPYFPELEGEYGDHEAVTFYNALDLPEICGGRPPKDIRSSICSDPRTFRTLSERYGPRFQLLANSTFPEFTPAVEEACAVLDRNGSSIIVSRVYLARTIKAFFPHLPINASSILSLYRPFGEIMGMAIFDKVCAPQFWNNDVEAMSHHVPVSQRGRVYYIVNSPCRWGKSCKFHYEAMSRAYTGRPKVSLTPWRDSCRRSQEPWSVGGWGKGVFEGLRDNGFTLFKLQGRDKGLEDLQYRLRAILG